MCDAREDIHNLSIGKAQDDGGEGNERGYMLSQGDEMLGKRNGGYALLASCAKAGGNDVFGDAL